MVQGGAITGTSDPSLYDSQRYGGSFSYVFHVPAGNYQATLLFAETYSGDFAAGKRVFNVLANGATVISNLDIFAQAGANTALGKVLNNIAAAGGTVTLQFKTTTGKDPYAVVEAVQIIPQPPTGNFMRGIQTLNAIPTPSPRTGENPSLLQSAVAAPNISRSGEPVVFKVQLAQAAPLQLTLFTLDGEPVYRAAWVGGAGWNDIPWPLENSYGIRVASGLYLFELEAKGPNGTIRRVGKILVMH